MTIRKYEKHGRTVRLYQEKRAEDYVNSPCCGENRTEYDLVSVLTVDAVPPHIFNELKYRTVVFDFDAP